MRWHKERKMAFLKIKDDKELKDLEKFGFVPYSDCGNNGNEYGYKIKLGNITYSIAERRENWLWRGGFVPLRVIDTYANDYEVSQTARDLEIIYDLTVAGYVEKVEEGE